MALELFNRIERTFSKTICLETTLQAPTVEQKKVYCYVANSDNHASKRTVLHNPHDFLAGTMAFRLRGVIDLSSALVAWRSVIAGAFA